MMQDMSMHILDIVQNSIRANATEITIKVNENIPDNFFSFTVVDNGCGIPRKMLLKIRDPFTTSRDTRKIGLGLPMLNETCETCKGFLAISSTEGEGTLIEANMLHNHLDRPPLGEIVDAVYVLMVTNPDVDFEYTQRYNDKKFTISTKEIKAELDGVPINEPAVMEWLKETLVEGVNEIKL